LAASWLRRLGLVGALHLTLLFGGAAAVVISPWVVRNQLRYGGSIVLENQGAYNLWSGNAKESPASVLSKWWQIDDPRRRSQVAFERGIQAIGEDPMRFARSYASRTLDFFGLEYFAVRHLAMGGYPDVPRSVLLVCFWIIQVGWMLAMLSAAAGLGPAWRDPTLRVVIIYGGMFVALVAAMVVTTRFRIPFTFVTAVAGGVGVDRVLAGRAGWRSVVLAATAVVLLGISASRPVFQQLIRADFATRADLVNRDWIFFRY